MYLWGMIVDRFRVARKRPAPIRTHLDETASWLCRAQDATPDGGVSAVYDLRKKRWTGSYPETTGYIIPTFFRYAKLSDNPGFAARARRMAEWETEIQLPAGGVRAGTMDAKEVAPTIFNTGQVLFGWAAAIEETREPKFESSLRKAANWLIETQDPDGAWRRFASPFATHRINTYNTRTAFGLARAYEATGESSYLDAAVANVRWAISRAQQNQWMPDNCLDNNDVPLTHTIAYSMRGILEVGRIAEIDQFVDFACKMGSNIAASQRADGSLPGRLDQNWRPRVRWSCVTGNSQMAINWFRLAELTGAARFADHARQANRFNMSIQDISSGNAGVRGGVKGSYPIAGGYLAYKYPNWAAKFLMDALMLELAMDRAS